MNKNIFRDNNYLNSTTSSTAGNKHPESTNPIHTLVLTGPAPALNSGVVKQIQIHIPEKNTIKHFITDYFRQLQNTTCIAFI